MWWMQPGHWPGGNGTAAWWDGLRRDCFIRLCYMTLGRETLPAWERSHIPYLLDTDMLLPWRVRTKQATKFQPVWKFAWHLMMQIISTRFPTKNYLPQILQECKDYVCRPALRILMAEASKNLDAFRPHELSRLIWAVSSQSCRHPSAANWSSDGNWMQLSLKFSPEILVWKLLNYISITNTYQVGVWTKHLFTPGWTFPETKKTELSLGWLVIRDASSKQGLKLREVGPPLRDYTRLAGHHTDGSTSVTGVISSNNLFSDMYFAGGTILWEIGFWKLNPFYHLRLGCESLLARVASEGW